MLLFDTVYLRNATRQRHSYNGTLTGTYKGVIWNDFEWQMCLEDEFCEKSYTY